MDSAKKKAASFKIEFPGDAAIKNEIQQKFADVKAGMRREDQLPLNNSQVLLKLLDHWLNHQNRQAGPEHDRQAMGSSYLPVNRDDTEERIFMTTKSSVQKCMDLASNHARICKEHLVLTSFIRRGHVALTRLRCKKIIMLGGHLHLICPMDSTSSTIGCFMDIPAVDNFHHITNGCVKAVTLV